MWVLSSTRSFLAELTSAGELGWPPETLDLPDQSDGLCYPGGCEQPSRKRPIIFPSIGVIMISGKRAKSIDNSLSPALPALLRHRSLARTAVPIKLFRPVTQGCSLVWNASIFPSLRPRSLRVLPPNANNCKFKRSPSVPIAAKRCSHPLEAPEDPS